MDDNASGTTSRRPDDPSVVRSLDEFAEFAERRNQPYVRWSRGPAGEVPP